MEQYRTTGNIASLHKREPWRTVIPCTNILVVYFPTGAEDWQRGRSLRRWRCH